MLSDTFQEQKRKEEVKKESPPKKVAFKNLDEDNKNKRGMSPDSDDSEHSRQVARQAKLAADKVAKRRGEPKPISERETMESVRANETPVEKVANWFKDIFNVCGNSSCCGSKNPYHDKQVWDDINERISYKVPKNEEEKPKKKKRHTELQPYDDNSII